MAQPRREFLEQVGGGMLFATLGSSLSAELGLATAQGAEDAPRLLFDDQETLVSLMQETEPEKLVSLLVERLESGTELKSLVAAGALANARTFGGQDYIGFHTFMALVPAWRMAQLLPSERQALPVLKVLYRNAQRIQDWGARPKEVLHSVSADAAAAATPSSGEQLREATRSGDLERSERAFAALGQGPVGEAFNHLQYAVQDEVDVHRVVLAWRAWDTREVAGERWGQTLLRQSVRYCAQVEQAMRERGRSGSPIRALLPKLVDQYRLQGKAPGNKSGDDTWVRELAQTFFRGTAEQAADAAAQALAAGYAPSQIGEALSIAACQLVLHDPGRPEQWANADKPVGSCHGDSVGVHASDAANAWRRIAQISNARNGIASLIVGAYHTGGQSGRAQPQPYPWSEHLAEVTGQNAESLLRAAEEAIVAKQQFLAAAAISRYGQQGHDPQPAFQLLLRFATSEDGALHAEKYYQTVSEEFLATRPAFRWNQVVALARVTASEYGHRSAGYEAARARLKLA